MSWGDRIRIFVVFLVGLIYMAFEIFEDLFNIILPFDEVFGLGVAAISYFLLIRAKEASPWQAWVVAGLWVIVNIIDWIIDWFAPDWSYLDEGLTALALIAVFSILFWPILKRMRLATNNT